MTDATRQKHPMETESCTRRCSFQSARQVETERSGKDLSPATHEVTQCSRSAQRQQERAWLGDGVRNRAACREVSCRDAVFEDDEVAPRPDAGSTGKVQDVVACGTAVVRSAATDIRKQACRKAVYRLPAQNG